MITPFQLHPTAHCDVSICYFLKKIFLCGSFNLATVQKWDAICVNKQSNISKPSLFPTGKGPSLRHLYFPQYPRPSACGKSTDELVRLSVYTEGDLRRTRARRLSGTACIDSVWVQSFSLLCSPHRLPKHQPSSMFLGAYNTPDPP